MSTFEYVHCINSLKLVPIENKNKRNGGNFQVSTIRYFCRAFLVGRHCSRV